MEKLTQAIDERAKKARAILTLGIAMPVADIAYNEQVSEDYVRGVWDGWHCHLERTDKKTLLAMLLTAGVEYEVYEDNLSLREEALRTLEGDEGRVGVGFAWSSAVSVETGKITTCFYFDEQGSLVAVGGDPLPPPKELSPTEKLIQHWEKLALLCLSFNPSQVEAAAAYSKCAEALRATLEEQ